MIRGPLPEASESSAPGTSLVSEPVRATWYCLRGGNDTYWRADAPASAVGGRVSYITEKQSVRAFTHPNRDTGLPWNLTLLGEDGVWNAATKKEWQDLGRARVSYQSVSAAFPEHQGAAVFTRPCLARATLARYMQEQEIRTVAETDDNYFSAPKHNLFLRQQGQHEQLTDAHAKAFASMDANVFSTEWLRDRYHAEYKRRFGKQHLPELHVCRNCIPQADWPARDEGDGTLRVGFMGSGSHVWDVNIAYTAFHAAKQAGCQTVMIGYNPGDPDPDVPDEIEIDGVATPIRSEKSKRFRDTWAKSIDRHIPWIDPGEYHRASLPVDIGLAPLRVDDFTLGKSDSKLIEYTINGAAVVASNMPVFTRAGWKHEVNCLLAGSQREMAEQTLRLIRDEKLRYELVGAAQEMVWNERNEATMREEWLDALNG